MNLTLSFPEAADASTHMGKCKLFTSLPAKPRSVEYQDMCLRSWREAGFDPISVNSPSELLCHHVPSITTLRDAATLVGKPLIFISDLIMAASEEARGEPFGIVNGDILLDPKFDLSNRVLSLDPGSAIIAHRVDIQTPDSRLGLTFPGFDFFALNPKRVFPDLGMVFGMPWWDHFLALMLIANGPTKQIRQPFAYHLDHPQAWDGILWTKFGYRLLNSIEEFGFHYCAFVRWHMLKQRLVRKCSKLIALSDANVAYIDIFS
jgi:hypothetical protein